MPGRNQFTRRTIKLISCTCYQAKLENFVTNFVTTLHAQRFHITAQSASHFTSFQSCFSSKTRPYDLQQAALKYVAITEPTNL